MTLYFSKDTNLLFKADFTGRFLDRNNKFVPFATFVEFFFGDYRVVDGVNHWWKKEQRRDGKKYSEMTLSEVKFLKNTDDSFFTIKGLEAEVRRVTAEYEIADRKDMIRQALARVGPGSGSEFSRLVKGLTHPDAGVRPLARNALLIYAEEWRKNQIAPFERADVDSLVVLLDTGEDVDLQTFALEGVTRLGSLAAQAVPPLVKIARDNRELKTLAGARCSEKHCRKDARHARRLRETSGSPGRQREGSSGFGPAPAGAGKAANKPRHGVDGPAK